MQCYNCRTSDCEPYASENGYELVKCKQCGLLYVSNPPSENAIEQAHLQGLHRGEQRLETTGRYNPTLKRFYTRVLSDLYRTHLPHEGTWLDIGCGYGEFIETLSEFSESSLETVGSEPNANKRAHAVACGLNVQFFDLDAHSYDYEFVSLLNVYSHLPDPPAFLKKVNKLLRIGGELLLQTGDTAHLSAEDHYRPFSLPDHLSFASEKILTDILEHGGFEVVQVVKYPVLARTPTTVMKELAKLVLPNFRSQISYVFSKKFATTNMFIRARKIAECT